MLEGILEGLFELIGELFSRAVLPVLYWTGWCVLRVVTFGRYPPRGDTYSPEYAEHSRGFVAAAGLLVWAGILIGLAIILW